MFSRHKTSAFVIHSLTLHHAHAHRCGSTTALTDRHQYMLAIADSAARSSSRVRTSAPSRMAAAGGADGAWSRSPEGAAPKRVASRCAAGYRFGTDRNAAPPSMHGRIAHVLHVYPHRC